MTDSKEETAVKAKTSKTILDRVRGKGTKAKATSKPQPKASPPPAPTMSRAQAKRERSARRRGKDTKGGTHMIKHTKRY